MPELEEDPDDDEEGEIELDALHPARLIGVHPQSPLVELHLLRLHVQDSACTSIVIDRVNFSIGENRRSVTHACSNRGVTLSEESHDRGGSAYGKLLPTHTPSNTTNRLK